MSQERIEKLTPEKEALIPVYREKWRKIALSTEPIDKEKAAKAIKKAYAFIGLSQPEVIFYSSPYSGFRYLQQLKGFSDWIGEQMRAELTTKLCSELRNKLQNQCGQVWMQLERHLESRQFITLCSQLENQLRNQFGSSWITRLYIQSEVWSFHGSRFDFCISALNCAYPRREWEVFKLLVKDCGWILLDDKICLVCDRPRVLSFDNQQRLHGEGAPAIQFADGYSLYAYHGVTLPKKYGTDHPHHWQASWLLEENNAELRRVLIQGIGYDRIAHELGAIELDSYQEYTLLKIDTDIDIEPIYLLKMTCPSTKFIHVLRVPPDVVSAREAIRWVNWGISPEEFAIQT
ncbi:MULTISPECIES: DUF6745 domain-containing protein [Cyanophyceae]|uniref:DUF6745 domain-containing protein n=1 Tax=Cyanophyceae TaxID=3028117 RepID=UPI0016869ADB|nr:hypothetical protein [Trichocoleus sp. FACHB-69]MBD1934530.1 hypothetical protein [Trichocoleus sp. FACHB-69]